MCPGNPLSLPLASSPPPSPSPPRPQPNLTVAQVFREQFALIFGNFDLEECEHGSAGMSVCLSVCLSSGVWMCLSVQWGVGVPV